MNREESLQKSSSGGQRTFKVKLAENIPGNPEQEFSWLVMAIRKGPDLKVEPRKDEVEMKGFGPYRYYREKP